MVAPLRVRQKLAVDYLREYLVDRFDECFWLIDLRELCAFYARD